MYFKLESGVTDVISLAEYIKKYKKTHTLTELKTYSSLVFYHFSIGSLSDICGTFFFLLTHIIIYRYWLLI